MRKYLDNAVLKCYKFLKENPEEHYTKYISFAGCGYAKEIMDVYEGTLRAHYYRNFRLNKQIKIDIENCNEEELGKYLFGLYRFERFCSGYILQLIQQGIYIKLLERYMKLYDIEIPETKKEKLSILRKPYIPKEIYTEEEWLEKQKGCTMSKNLKNDFRDYLVKQGYSEYTPSGNPSTVYDYQKRIDKICQMENISWEQLAQNINKIVKEYDIGGCKESEGKKSHNAVICALKQYQMFIR